MSKGAPWADEGSPAAWEHPRTPFTCRFPRGSTTAFSESLVLRGIPDCCSGKRGVFRISVANPCLIEQENTGIHQKIIIIDQHFSDNPTKMFYFTVRADAICNTFADHSVVESSSSAIVRRFEAECRPGIPRRWEAQSHRCGSIYNHQRLFSARRPRQANLTHRQCSIVLPVEKPSSSLFSYSTNSIHP